MIANRISVPGAAPTSCSCRHNSNSAVQGRTTKAQTVRLHLVRNHLTEGGIQIDTVPASQRRGEILTLGTTTESGVMSQSFQRIWGNETKIDYCFDAILDRIPIGTRHAAICISTPTDTSDRSRAFGSRS